MKLPPGHVAGQGVAKPTCTGGFGERMLRSMGWDSGQGLGKEGTGIKEAIQVKKKEDTVGVGGNGSWAWGERWWEKAYDSAVQTVGASSDSSDSSDSDSDDEHYAMVAAVAMNRDGTRTSASADELKLLASLTKQKGRVAAGRFGGRDAKMARIRQQEAAMADAAAAKLGMSSAPSAVATTGTTATGGAGGAGASDRSETTSEAKVSSKRRKKDKKAKSGGDEGEGGTEASSGGKKRKAKRGAAGGADQQPQQQREGGDGQLEGEQPKKQRIVIEPKIAHVGPVFQFVPTPATGWWGDKVFASAGCMEGLDQEAAEAARRRVTFDEDDQARIYNNAQAKKTQGKVGLGQGTGTVKVGGVKWEGRKVTFEDPAAAEGGGDDAEEAAAAAATGGARLAAIGSCTHLATLASAGGGDADAAPSGGGEGGEGWSAQIKWRKLIGAQLAAAEGGRLKLKELQRAVVAAVLAKHASLAPSKAAVKAEFEARLGASTRFVVEGKLVRLKS